MKPRAYTLAYDTARKQLSGGTFISLHACRQEVNKDLTWGNDELVEEGILTALKEYHNE